MNSSNAWSIDIAYFYGIWMINFFYGVGWDGEGRGIFYFFVENGLQGNLYDNHLPSQIPPQSMRLHQKFPMFIFMFSMKIWYNVVKLSEFAARNPQMLPEFFCKHHEKMLGCKSRETPWHGWGSQIVRSNRY